MGDGGREGQVIVLLGDVVGGCADGESVGGAAVSFQLWSVPRRRGGDPDQGARVCHLWKHAAVCGGGFWRVCLVCDRVCNVCRERVYSSSSWAPLAFSSGRSPPPTLKSKPPRPRLIWRWMGLIPTRFWMEGMMVVGGVRLRSCDGAR